MVYLHLYMVYLHLYMVYIHLYIDVYLVYSPIYIYISFLWCCFTSWQHLKIMCGRVPTCDSAHSWSQVVVLPDWESRIPAP